MALVNETELTLPPNLPSLKNMDALLRCPICFEFLNIAMMTKCSHNFCSLCIRKFLSYKLQCPVCNSPTTQQELRNNRILDDLVTTFHSARQQLSNCNFDSPPLSPKTPRQRAPRKDTSISHFFQKAPPASTTKTSLTEETQQGCPARQGKRLSRSGQNKGLKDSKSCDQLLLVKEECMEVEIPAPMTVSVKLERVDSTISVLEGTIADSPSTSQNVKPVVKVECPVCSVGISEQFINKHLDTCLTRGEKQESLRSSVGSNNKRKPMGKLVYTLLSMQELKRRLKECHLSTNGPRDQLIRRHQEFVHIYNAQCDALLPKSAEDIAKEVEAAEKMRNQLQGKTQRAMVFTKNQSAEEIDEMHSKYRRQHSSDFSRLIAEVRGRLETSKLQQVKEKLDREGVETDERTKAKNATGEAGGLGDGCDGESRPSSGGEEAVWEVTSGSSSPSHSPVSISSSISDVFSPEPEKCFKHTDTSKRPSCSRDEDAIPPLILRKRQRKT